VAVARGLTPLVGRESEVTLLLERWEQVKSDQGQVILLTGDPGIGKSRLVQTLKDYVVSAPHIRWECRSAEYYQNTALFPLTDLFQRLLRSQAEDTLGACPRISLISSLHRSLAYQLYAGGDATLVASPWLCNAIAAPEGRARRRGMPSEGAHTAKSARSTSP
jgi:energy-coupling factor transporter ATP-binding protein EcfA2